jgi:DNA-binding NarL/FixJ family response regulator
MADPPGPAAQGLATELSHQDVELLKLLAGGLPLDSVARRLGTSERTVRRRVKAVCDRLGVGTSIQAVAWAARRGLVLPV